LVISNRGRLSIVSYPSLDRSVEGSKRFLVVFQSELVRLICCHLVRISYLISHRSVAFHPLQKHPLQHRNLEISVVEIRTSDLSRYVRWRRPAYCTSVPLHETGIARNSVSSRGSSKPSPESRPVEITRRSVLSDSPASRSRASLLFRVLIPPWRTMRVRGHSFELVRQELKMISSLGQNQRGSTFLDVGLDCSVVPIHDQTVVGLQQVQKRRSR